MGYTLINPNLDSSGYSEDNFLQHELDMGVNIALVRNSPKLVAMNADARVNITSIYRAAGDGNFSKPAGQFISERYSAAPQAAYLHLTNEAGLPPSIGAWSLQCADVAERIGRKVVAFNAATNTDLALWKGQESAIRELVRRGHRIGLHLYLDGKHDAGGYAAADWLASIGADCLWTEYGYIRTITNDGEGYRGVLDDGYADWLEAHAAKLASYGWPAFLFSIDQWPNNDEGRAKGFGTEDRPKIQQRCKVINERYPLMTTQPPVYSDGVNPVPKMINVPDGLKLRSTPSLSGVFVRKLEYREQVTVYAAPVIPADSYNWQRVTDGKGLVGWSANYVDGKPSWVDPSTDAKRIVIENMPYSNEFGWRTGWTALCGETSLYMLLLHDRQWRHVALPPEITPLSIASYLGKGAKDFTTLNELGNASVAYGLKTHLDTGLFTDPLALLTTEIDQRHPVICLLDYSKLPTRWDKKFSGGHILVVVGYSDQSIICHDPDAQNGAGKFVEYPRADFKAAWAAMGSQALVLG